MLPLLSLVLAAAVQTDTLVVKEAKIEGPYPISAVQMTDSFNLEGKRYDIPMSSSKTLRWHCVPSSPMPVPYGMVRPSGTLRPTP